MKDYKRLTDSAIASMISRTLDNRLEAKTYIRLAELEDKIESGELCDRNEIIIVKGKVIDEPNEWVYGQLLPNNRIFQQKEHTESKNCGVGVFEVIPETIKPIEMCDREEVRKETAREIYNWLFEHSYDEESKQLVKAFHECFLED